MKKETVDRVEYARNTCDARRQGNQQSGFRRMRVDNIDSRQGLHQGGLPVVDVPGRTDDDILHATRRNQLLILSIVIAGL